jgi:hypothetical protein
MKTKQVMPCVFGLGSVLFLLLAETALSQEQSLYEQVLNKLESLQPTANIEVNLGTEKDQYDVGEAMEFRFASSQDCHVVLMDIGAADENAYGNITFLMPNHKLSETKIIGGRVYSTLQNFGLKIRVGPPAGF